MNISLTFALDAATLEGAVTEAVEAVSLTGLGPDGTSEYEVTGVDVDASDPTNIVAHVTIDRIQGKFVSKDEMTDTLVTELEGAVEATVEVTA